MKNSHEEKRSILISSIQAQAAWAVSALLFLLLFCIIAYTTDDPDSITMPLSLCALYLSSIIGGIAAVRISGDGIMSGLLSGIITAVIIFMLTLLPVPESHIEMPMSLLYTSLVIPASIIGSALGHKRPAKPSSRLKKKLK